MCGIIACLNCDNTRRILLEGLKQLQNRGYDSCGISVFNNTIHTQKYATTNDTKSLYKLENEYNLPESNIGIAHTRWATHGGITDDNAHPHESFDNNLSLVHNGIITNYSTLKKELIQNNVIFKSETDTEVISNLISYNLDKDDIFNSIVKSIKKLEGSWGIVFMLKDYENSLFISKSGSPLLIGKTDKGIIVASEISAFCNRSINVITLEDGDVIEININQNIINSNKETNLSLSNFFKNKNKIELNNLTISTSPYPFNHWMIKEINEQPIAILRTLNYGARIINKVKLGGLNDKKDLIINKKELIILGCGTSLNAGAWISSLIKKQNIFDKVNVIDASEFELYEINNNNNILVLVLSQSGETKDVHRCMIKIKKLNIPIIGIVNSVGSLISRETNCGIYLNAGREVAVASTKSFTCQQVALVLFLMWFMENKNISNFTLSNFYTDLKSLPHNIETTISNMNNFKHIALNLTKRNNCFILGKNICYNIAQEAALKLKEIGYIHAEAFPGGSLKHGPFSLIEEGTPIILLILDDEYKEFLLSTLEEVKSRKAYTIVISNFNIENKLIDDLIIVPKLNVLSSIPLIVPFQILSYEMALIKKHNPDFPRNLAKVVTVD